MAKTLSFTAVHMTIAFAVGYAMTGSAWVGGALALVEPLCNAVAYHFHERLWKRIESRRRAASSPRTLLNA
ncbi:DUF2061 domain-containing protein [Rehaibacterium terrae]|jgi:uncharacterized membrane protein|uniref:Putative membrane protein n=1 Tax=Rehaibacterium terrae TaxID=1341696 RepID=A0A7W7Y1K5_9GAMM|nr:DUF2061 domain-containing protein [Rehaibacterium terrae]MBB5016385.1 putative membrane protein [Rehaibacterium terrae]